MTEILVATDAAGVFGRVRDVLESPERSVRWVRRGEDVRGEMERQPADMVITDMQIGTMGGIAVCMDLLLEADAGRLERRPVLILLDRRPDVFLARRSGADGWILKPLDPIRLARAAEALLAGGTYHDDRFRPSPAAMPVK